NARLRDWVAHYNAVFGISWIKGDSCLLTASGDQTIKVWDVEENKCTGVLIGHTGTVKSMCSHPTHSGLFLVNFLVISELKSLLKHPTLIKYVISFSINCCRIYLYNILQLDKGPVESFSGCRIDSFFVRTMISSDGEYILSGSSDGNAYIWQVNKPQVDPTILKGHDSEVTAVDWSSSEIGKVATASDDFTVRLWNIENNLCTTANASRVKRRVTALSNTEAAKERLEINREPESPQKHSSDDASEEDKTCERTPETAVDSPSSVLNPPSAVKRRTIRDYFLVTP
ncbi:unnamed protein product, partial [Brassica oleracea]